jgi:hypothetical protein
MGGPVESLPGFDAFEKASVAIFGGPTVKASSKDEPTPTLPGKKGTEAVKRKKRAQQGLDFSQLGTILTGPQGATLGGANQSGKKTLLGE